MSDPTLTDDEIKQLEYSATHGNVAGETAYGEWVLALISEVRRLRALAAPPSGTDDARWAALEERLNREMSEGDAGTDPRPKSREAVLEENLSWARHHAERDAEREFYCGCEHHRPGVAARALWDEDGRCQVCGVDVDPWTIRALAAESSAARLRAALGFAASVIKSGEPWTETCERMIGGALSSPGAATPEK